MPIDERDITLTENGLPTIPVHYISTVIDKSTLAGASLSTRFSAIVGNNPDGEVARHQIRLLKAGVEKASIFFECSPSHFTTNPVLTWTLRETRHASTPAHSGTVTMAVTPDKSWTYNFPESEWYLAATIGYTVVSGFTVTIAKTPGTNGVVFEFTVKEGSTVRLKGTATVAFETEVNATLVAVAPVGSDGKPVALLPANSSTRARSK